MPDKDLEDLVNNSIHSSLGSLFQQLVTDKSFHSSNKQQQSEASIGDFGGSDFKRLALKSRQRQAAEEQGYQARRWSSTSSSASSSSSYGYEDDDEEETLSNSPSMDDMQPRRPFMLGQPQHIILPRPTQAQKKRPGFMNKLYDVFFTHEDFYFNNDRNELSKDIFPTEQRPNWKGSYVSRQREE